ncbi:proteasome regulatory particle base subunit [Coemansia helicoidea]|uniref:Proteasome regulatory particle base subunit n=1 Tax=Coemansia helicoidea TaxID=1286919 RepID=A0ACC1LA41_9FUNG|nr:proteasome regulatory particle base subunit [Coemansia helicoidea]
MRLTASARLLAGLGALCGLLAGAVRGEVVAANVVVRVLERTGDALVEQALTYPAALPDVPTVKASTPLIVAFDAQTADGAPLQLDHAVLSLHHAETGAEVAFAAQRAKGGQYKASIPRKEFRRHLASAPGRYTLALVLGSFEHGGLVYELGAVDVAGKRAGPRRAALGPKLEIRHRFADPQRMPSAAVSLAFAGLVAAPLAGLAHVWARLGVNASNLKREAAGSAAFMALVAAYMALAVAYWVGGRLLPTLGYVLALALPTYLAGQRALSRRIERGM